MERFKFLKKEEVSNLPKTSGVYAFKSKREILYIGKAINIKERVKNHFQKSSFRDNLFIDKVENVGFIKTNSEIAALILEANLIKKYQPKYNIMWRDDKNFFYVGITKQNLPRIFITHQTKKEKIKNGKQTVFIGPFVDGTSLKKTLKILRKIFPYYTVKKHSRLPCTWCHLGLCPGPNPDEKKYKKNIKNLISILKGKSAPVLKSLKKEMKKAAKLQEYEKAAGLRDKIQALQRTISHAKIFEEIKAKKDKWEKIEKELKKILKTKKKILRIEAYDVSNIQGQKATGSMVTFIQGNPEKDFYRRFKIKSIDKPNDIAMIEEVLERRFKHLEWKMPDVILIDGGKAQLNIAIKTKNRNRKTKNISVISLAKKQNKLYIENRKDPILLKKLSKEVADLILQIRDEAHRFAITYHRKLRKKELFG